MKYIVLWLEGPLQSWGESSKYGRRETLAFPTKSGVYGMLLAAMGSKGEQEELLAKLAPLPQKVLSFGSSSQMMDFHMIGSGYDSSDPWQKLAIPRKVDGVIPTGTGGSKMTYRYYLQDAKFAVIQGVSDELLDPIVDALKHPVYSPSLGRKSCVPTEFIFQGIYDSQEEAEEHAKKIAGEKCVELAYDVRESSEANPWDLAVQDVPIVFGSHKKYAGRYVEITEYAKT
ncbi:MAG TPA: type I-E CRISPR-associated protein Cas5/CasD [Sphaerochaeta sp.]|jgi:CRISPR system Cascade subunit CasD|nr:type I-E CRISPR-associated protein Cas5/CasD [Spirochaetota bacterium]HOE90015.1 type I-E CRISPR-associated protein Cas5/CasD [Sphaerochaeta sp.]HPK63841.1 type I-E CRISPR-associated protein Cas5/CasD [Sphaerochaeta sp.]